MKTTRQNLLGLAVTMWLASIAVAQPQHLSALTEPQLGEFLQAHCVHCHDHQTTTRFDFSTAVYDLSDSDQRRFWTEVYDQLLSGRMPPASEPPPDAAQLQSVTELLAQNLRSATLQAQQTRGRVPVRRLTRTEYQYSVQDLLQIHGPIADSLPAESREGAFDTVAATQKISAMHIEGYLAAADQAISMALRLHRTPFQSVRFDLLNNEHLNSFHDRDLQVGGNISRKLEDGVVIFRDVDYLLRSDLHGFRIGSKGSGYYRIQVSAEAFQSASPMALKVIVKDISGLTELVGACDLIPGEPQTFEVDAWLTRTKVFYVAFLEDRPAAQILADIYDDGGGKKYTGPGIKVTSIRVEGPMTGGWPPASTKHLLRDIPITEDDDGIFQIHTADSTAQHLADIVDRLAERAFRRPLEAGERDAFVNTARSAMDADQKFEDVVRIPLRAILSAPQFVLLTGKAGTLDDDSLASRLSYFLWKSVPDQELLNLASQGQLSKPSILMNQVNRMLDDRKVDRFVKDFTGQWLRLNEINLTTPDERLYPEYDELLHWSVPQETAAFFKELIAQDLSIRHLIDSDFTFLNRRLATHYGIDAVMGQEFRRVALPQDSVRGGVLTQASILKVTANGLVTSPVKRGDFVLSDLLGTPPPPPPDNVGSIEPDVSKATTIRELLVAHRDSDACRKCHQQIDPPGFALECFDPIGAFRTHYRISSDDFLTFVAHTDGAAVDSSGTTADGRNFNSIQDFKKLLLAKQEQLARHFVTQLIVYATGGEIEFTDREVVDDIIASTRPSGFPVRTLIQEVIHSRLFLER